MNIKPSEEIDIKNDDIITIFGNNTKIYDGKFINVNNKPNWFLYILLSLMYMVYTMPLLGLLNVLYGLSVLKDSKLLLRDEGLVICKVIIKMEDFFVIFRGNNTFEYINKDVVLKWRNIDN